MSVTSSGSQEEELLLEQLQYDDQQLEIQETQINAATNKQAAHSGTQTADSNFPTQQELNSMTPQALDTLMDTLQSKASTLQSLCQTGGPQGVASYREQLSNVQSQMGMVQEAIDSH